MTTNRQRASKGRTVKKPASLPTITVTGYLNEVAAAALEGRDNVHFPGGILRRDIERLGALYHEAGHAYVAFHYGLKFEAVWVMPTRIKETREFADGMVAFKPERLKWMLSQPQTLPKKMRLSEMCVVISAGHASQKRFVPWSTDADHSDRRMAKVYLGRALGYRPTQILLKHVEDVARGVVCTDIAKRCITQLALALYTHRILSGIQVFSFFRHVVAEKKPPELKRYRFPKLRPRFPKHRR